ncbi:hypothetical protein [uncultured Bradyrhizobium sp.]|uniref:hypothetical protein n=1 Tax=uncultured Bradyrhizobium sp. TaxID=199684 RepID=UPI0035CBDBF9
MIDSREVIQYLNRVGLPKLNEANIWGTRDGRVAIGVVLLVRKNQNIVVVRKETVKNYEFSDMLSLPGGVVRGLAPQSFAASFERSLLARARDEAGLNETDLSDFRTLPVTVTPVSRYTAKGASRLTVLFPVEAKLERPVKPEATRSSVKEVFFAALPLDWKAFAPANRLILAWAFADQISAQERIMHADQLQSALTFCNSAAEDAGLPHFRNPWTDY